MPVTLIHLLIGAMHARDGDVIHSANRRLLRWLTPWSSAPSLPSSNRCGIFKIQHALPQLSGQLRRRTDRRARLPNTTWMLASRCLHRPAAPRALVAVGRLLFTERSIGAPVASGTLCRAPQPSADGLTHAFGFIWIHQRRRSERQSSWAARRTRDRWMAKLRPRHHEIDQGRSGRRAAILTPTRAPVALSTHGFPSGCEPARQPCRARGRRVQGNGRCLTHCGAGRSVRDAVPFGRPPAHAPPPFRERSHGSARRDPDRGR
jgi:hypothetical protein